MDEKYATWAHLKSKLNVHPMPPTFKEREIWWCSVGMNIGFEVFGKGAVFTRPVLVVRKFNRSMFWGVPMSTKLKDIPHHRHITFKGETVALLLDQLRAFDSKRLAGKLGSLTDHQFDEVRTSLRDMF